MRSILASLCLNRLVLAQVDLGERAGLPGSKALELLRAIVEETIVYCAHRSRILELVRRLGLTERVLDEFPTTLAVNTFRVFDHARSVFGCAYDELFVRFDLATLLAVSDVYALKILMKRFATDLVARFQLQNLRADMADEVLALWQTIDAKIAPLYSE